MKRVDTEALLSQNILLSSLPAVNLRSVAAKCRIVEVTARKVLHEYGEPIRTIYFPLTAVLSLFSSTAEGSLIACAIVGPEASVGYPFALSGDPMPFRIVVEVPGTVLKLPEKILWD